MNKLLLLLFLGFLSNFSTYSHADVNGKADIGLTWVHIDLLEHGKTVHKMDLPGIRGDLSYKIWKGLLIKPQLLLAHGGHSDHVVSAGIGFGACLPVRKGLFLTPIIGINCGHLKTVINLNLPINVIEKFRSYSPYIGLEGSWTFCKVWRIVGCYQYAWSYTNTHFTKTHTPADIFLKTTRSHTEGSSISGMIEHDFTDWFSMNLGGAYNSSLTKEKHGVRAYGLKLGFAVWF